MTATAATLPAWTAERMPRLDGTTIIVTGANSGIGLEAVRAFARQGAHVVIAVRDKERGWDAAATVQGSGRAGASPIMPKPMKVSRHSGDGVDVAGVVELRIVRYAWRLA